MSDKKLLQSLIALCDVGAPLCESAPPGISVYRRTAQSALECYDYDPVLCLVLQGGKTVRSGDHSVEVTAGDALVVSHQLPVISQITQASSDEPYLAVVLSLDLSIMRQLSSRISDEPYISAQQAAVTGKPARYEWIEPLRRYLDLADKPQDLAILGPSIMREIHYRLLMSEPDSLLSSLLVADSRASQIAQAIRVIRQQLFEPLLIADLAAQVNMSGSAFHQHFKSITGTTPLQYQKDLRLIASRELLEAGNRSVSAVAFQVGYESPTQFSREYKRRFGVTPSST